MACFPAILSGGWLYIKVSFTNIRIVKMDSPHRAIGSRVSSSRASRRRGNRALYVGYGGSDSYDNKNLGDDGGSSDSRGVGGSRSYGSKGNAYGYGGSECYGNKGNVDGYGGSDCYGSNGKCDGYGGSDSYGNRGKQRDYGADNILERSS